jgi:small redox-active disulfide protein 2
MKIEVLGRGCANCRRLEENAKEAAGMAGIEADVVHIYDEMEIARRGILRTPGLYVDGKLVSYGRVPSAGDIAVWISEA